MSPQAVSSFAPQTLGKDPKFSRPRVLIADDHDMVLEHVLSLLKRYEVVATAQNGMELVTEALRLEPDLIISDITMTFPSASSCRTSR